MFESWISAFQNAGYAFLDRLIIVVPSIIGSGLILILGSLLAMGLGEICGTIVEKLKVDVALEKTILQPVNKTLGFKVNIGKVIEELVKWFILIIVFIAAADVARLHQINDFLNQVLLYLPNVFVAVVILIVSSLLATFVGNVINTATKDDSGYFSGLARISIYTFAVLAALHQLQISKPLIEILFTGIIATCVLAFGLGGKEVAGEIVKKAYEDFKKKTKR